jgi:hypothetical protein
VSTYNRRTGELTGVAVCRYCDALVTSVPQFVREYQPELVAVWHLAANCCDAVEPIR